MDKIDRKIISLLQENARYPLKYLAQKVFLSSPAVSTRIERLEKNGIIRREGVDYDARLKRLVPTEKAVQMEEIVRRYAGAVRPGAYAGAARG